MAETMYAKNPGLCRVVGFRNMEAYELTFLAHHMFE